MSDRPKPVEWPTSKGWWWMRHRRTKRSKWRVLLVSLIEHGGREYITPHEDNNSYPKSFTEDWNATFLPAETPPIDEVWK